NSSDLFRLPSAAAFTGAQVSRVEELLAVVIEEVREQAVPLVDAFGMSDSRLNSALGRSDGKVYDNYLLWAMQDPLNTQDTGEEVRRVWFDKYIKPVLHSAETSKNNAKL
ncbi:Acyl-coenzyme A oxidase (Acyl-CoA oxidase), partial [Kickxella alabastrina]